MAVTVEVGLDLSANDPTAYFTLDDFTRGVLDNATYPLGGDEWVDVTSKVRSVRCTRGRSSSLGRFTAATGQVVLDNRDRYFDPSYAPTYVRDILAGATLWLDAQFATASQTVPNLGTGGSALNARLGSTVAADSNDPTFLAYDGDPYLYLPGVSGNYASVPDAAALDITGDIDIRVRVALDDWTPASTQMLIAKENEGSQRSYWLVVESTGVLRFYWSSTGSYSAAETAPATVATGIADGAAKWVRVTLDVDNGAAGRDLKYWLSDDGVTWTQLGTTVTQAGTTSIFNSTTALTLGAWSSGSGFNAAGKFYRAQIFDGINGTKVLDVDASVLTSGAATSFTATTGQTVTINRSTSGRKAVAVVGADWLRGMDDYASVADAAALDYDASASFSVGWVGRVWATPTSGGTFVAKRTTGQGWALTQTTTTHGATFTISDGTNSASATSPASSSGALRLYVAVVNRTAQTLTVYCNGVAGTPVSISSVGSLANAEDMRIGRLSGASTSYSDAEDTAAIVASRALTAAEIAGISTYYASRTAIPGTATVDRIDAVMDGTGSPYYGSIVPRKPVRIKDGAELIALLRAERWDLDYSLSGDSLALLALTDSLGDLATTTVPAVAVPAEPTGTRITAILDAIGYPTDTRDIDTGRARLAAATIADGTNAAAYLQKVEASEPGALFTAKDGTLTYRDRAALQDYSDGIAFGTDLPFTEPMSVTSGADDMTNRAIVVWSGGTATVDNATSQARYRIITRTVDTLLESGDDAEALGTWIVNRDATPRLRVDSLTVHRHGLSAGQVTSLHSLDVGDPVGVTWTPNNVGEESTQRAVVDSIAHDITAGGTRHTVTFALSPANAAFILDDADFGVLGSSALGY